MASARSLWDRAIGLRNSSRRISPGWVGSRGVGTRTIGASLAAISSMVVHDFDVVRLVLGPDEADPVLVVDPNAVLALSIAGEGLEAFAGRDPEIGEALGGIELVELAKGHGPEVWGATAAGLFGVAAIED